MSNLVNKHFSDAPVLAALPLMAVCKTAWDALAASVIIMIAMPLADISAHLLRKFISRSALLFARTVIAVGFIGVFSAICTLFAQEAVSNLGIYLYLPAVTTLIFASGNSDTATLTSIKESGIFAAAFFVLLFTSGVLRELLGMGSLFGADIYTKIFAPIGFFVSPAGGLFVAAILLILCRSIFGARRKEEGNE